MDRNTHIPQRGASERLDDVNNELLRASWEVDFLVKAAAVGDTPPPAADMIVD
jgi:hypothetical protein